jgi:hypothetical protein
MWDDCAGSASVHHRSTASSLGLNFNKGIPVDGKCIASSCRWHGTALYCHQLAVLRPQLEGSLFDRMQRSAVLSTTAFFRQS